MLVEYLRKSSAGLGGSGLRVLAVFATARTLLLLSGLLAGGGGRGEVRLDWDEADLSFDLIVGDVEEALLLLAL